MSLLNMLFDMSPFRRLVVVDFDTAGAVVSLMEFEDNNPKLLAYEAIPCKEVPYAESSGEFVSALREFVSKHKVGGCSAVAVLPGQWVFPRFVRLPPVPEDKVAHIVRYEAEQNIPFPINEVAWDYAMTKPRNEGELEAVIVAVKDDIVESCFETIRASGLCPKYADVSAMCIANLVEARAPQAVTVVVSMGTRGTDVVFVEDGRMFARQIPIGVETAAKDLSTLGNGMDLADAMAIVYAMKEGSAEALAPTLVRLNAEITRTTSFYRSQQGGGQPAIGLAAGFLTSLGLGKALIEDRMRIASSDIATDVECAFSMTELWRTNCARDAGRLVGAAGIAIRESGKGSHLIKLIPRSVGLRHQRLVRAAKAFMAVFVLAMLAVGGITYGLMNRRVLEPKQAPRQVVAIPDAPPLAAIDNDGAIIDGVSKAVADAGFPVASFDRGNGGRLVRAVVSGNASDSSEAIKYADRILAAWPESKMTLTLRQSGKEGCHFEVTLSR